MLTLQDILAHAAAPTACYSGPIPTMVTVAEDQGFIEISRFETPQQMVCLVRLTNAGHDELDRLDKAGM